VFSWVTGSERGRIVVRFFAFTWEGVGTGLPARLSNPHQKKGESATADWADFTAVLGGAFGPRLFSFQKRDAHVPYGDTEVSFDASVYTGGVA